MPRRRQMEIVTDVGLEMKRRNEWERMNLTGGRKVLAELEALRRRYESEECETYDMYIEDAMGVVRKYIAIDDIVKNPSGMEEPGKITVESILNENAEVRMQQGGWELVTHRSPEEIARLEAKFDAERLKSKESEGE